MSYIICGRRGCAKGLKLVLVNEEEECLIEREVGRSVEEEEEETL